MRLATTLNARAYADGGGARVGVGASRACAYATKGRVVRCGRADVNGEDKMRGAGLWAGPQPN
jgi:hypothetical protein